MMVFMTLFWVAFIAGIVILIRWLASRSSDFALSGKETAVDILRRRYASGEITRDQYMEMMRDLESTGKPAGQAT